MSYVVEGRVGREKAPVHTHEQEEYWFIIEGQGKALLGLEEVNLTAGDLVIIPARLPHTVWSETGMRELAFMIDTGTPDARANEVEAKRQRAP
jgi:mannose-6-phosphate isomerase-like protein (cupin superfamily)